MNTLNVLMFLDAAGFHVMRMLISVFWQSSLLFGAIALIVCALRRKSVAVRHLLWVSVLCTLPVIPFLVWIASTIGTPQAEIPVIPAYSVPVPEIINMPQQSTSPESLSATGTLSIKPTDYPWALALLGYVTAALFFLSTVAVSRFRIWRWRQYGVIVDNTRTVSAFRAARLRLVIGRNISIVESRAIAVPLTIGTLHPAVLLPAGFTDNLSDSDLQSLAVHECAHVKRFDSLVLTLTAVIRALFFFHPLVWYAARQVAALAESACDNAVVDIVNKPVDYAEMLTRMAVKLPKRIYTTELAAGFFISRHEFLHRVEAILKNRRGRIKKLSWLAISGTMIAVLIALVVTCSLPLKEKKSSGVLKTQACGIMQPDDTVTEFVGVEKQVIDAHELAGVVYDKSGSPLEGVMVDAWTWHTKSGHEDYTDAQGRFKLTNLSADNRVEVRFSKEGYSPELIVKQEMGVGNIIVRLGNKTYFEGKVIATDGRPIPDALIRADQGPKHAHGVVITSIWTETTSGAEGNYRLYVDADTYNIQVRVPGVGVARLPEQVIINDQAKKLDIHLERGVTFRAKVINSKTGKPVEGVRLWHWQHVGVEGISDRNGLIEISGMMPGPFEFQVEADGITRWWSEKAKEWQRKMISKTTGWQRNFDYLEFDLKVGMKPVEIIVEDGVTITGSVLDPDGNPVAGATVAPARTGTGNSITGDTRFSVLTKDDGSFEMLLPASGEAEYNLVAHDGDYGEWRTWANCVMEPIKTKPGQVIRDIEIRLNHPCTVRGIVKDKNGKPMINHKVRAHAADLKANSYYDPTTRTDEQGKFTLLFIRPGAQFIQADPFFLRAAEAPERTTELVYLKAGEVKEGVNLMGMTDEDLRNMKPPK